MDTFPTCEVGQYDFEGRWGNRRLIPGFAMLPDINDDGYDDWGIYFQEYWEQYNNDGFYIFFGGEEPDMEPDLEIVGKQRLWDDRAEIAGGDFNGDGIGDIVTGFSTSPYGGEIHIHFGGRYINPEPDIYFHSGNWYDERFDRMGFSKLGAVGDYNGDGVDDFVVAATGGEYIARTLIVAGNPDWEVGVSNDRIPDSFSYSLTASPNPFNNSINISFDLPVNGQLELVVYDIKGRKIDILVDQRMVKGSHGISWQSNQSGVYLFVLWNGDRREVRKVVCMR
jgi:hypothetical protein